MTIAVILPTKLNDHVPVAYAAADGRTVIEVMPRSQVGPAATKGEELEAAGERAGRIYVVRVGEA